MTFDVYFPFVNKNGVTCPGVHPVVMSWEDIRRMCAEPEQLQKVKRVQSTEGDEKAEAKKHLPAICFCGRTTKTRANKNMSPTDLVFIDIDHCENPFKAATTLIDEMGDVWLNENVLLIHVTVSGKGLRIIFKAQPDMKTLQENMDWFNKTFDLQRFGDFDAPCKDYARLSFLPTTTDFLFENDVLAKDDKEAWQPSLLTNQYFEEGSKPKEGELFSSEDSVGGFSEEEIAEFEAYEYRGSLVKSIIDKWVEVQGTPGKGEIHNYYNEMIKNFRNIVSNNKRALLYLLPRFGHTAEECWSSIISICRVNTLSTLPKPFYFFLKDNGFYKKATQPQGSLAEYMLSDEPEDKNEPIPWLPPVFREWVRITPKDFRPSVINALMPVMGTLTSYLQAPYYYDGRMHTTSFFSIIYAPAGTGKGFVERINEVMFQQLKIRDYIQQARENIYLSTIARKGANEKAPEDPHTMLRIIPPKNSEAEFLQKMKDNQGYHMFTYAAEMDSWAKGVKAAGGNKDDMIRIAWDNGEYGQQFKSANTFKGVVSLYWNVLITGTVQQIMSYFKNVENGLITRCAFTTIENQEFADAPLWKTMNKTEKGVLQKFLQRCDNNTYEEHCNLLPDDVDSTSVEDFDKNIKWRFTYRKRKTIDMKWLQPTIEQFLKEQQQRASVDVDKARDVFRRRVAVRGFRLGIICYGLWDKPRQADLLKCIPFIKWWMDKDIEESLKLWGARYNNEVMDAVPTPRRALYNDLPQAFTKTEVYNHCVKMSIKTPVRNIIYLWIKQGFVKKIGDNEYEKIQPKT